MYVVQPPQKKSSPNQTRQTRINLQLWGKKNPANRPGDVDLLGAEDQIVIYHFLDGTGGVDPEAAAPGIFSAAEKNLRFFR